MYYIYYIKLDTIKVGWSIINFKGSKVRILKLNCICVNDFFISTKSADCGERPNSATSYLGLHYVLLCLFS